MKDEAEGDSALWIRGQDELGRPIDADIVAAAKRNWTRVLTYAESRRQDGSIAAEALEYAVQSLALLKERHPRARARIRNLDYYIFWAAVHRLDRLARVEPEIEYLGSLDDLNPLSRTQDSDLARQIEKDLVVNEVVGYMNEQTRYLFSLRQMGYSWGEIAEGMDSTAHNAESLFSKGLEKARRRILGRARMKRNPTPDQGRSE
jgi:DNA-directed RNA polymerase specialized sigma24 family protein